MALLIILAPYILVLSIIIVLILVFVKRGLHKLFLTIAACIGMWLYLFAETIPARMKFNELCEKDAGIHIYKTKELGSEYFNEGKLDYDRLIEEEVYIYKREQKKVSNKYNISRLHHSIIIDKEIYAEIFIYTYKGGKFFNRILPGEDCPNKFRSSNVLKRIFKEKEYD
jgi:hypothetical protein